MGTHPIFESDFDCLTDRFGQKNMSLVSPDKFQHILRVQNTNIDGCRNIMFTPRQYKIPDWFLNRQKDWKDGTFGQSISNGLDTKLREDLERLKKIRAHRGLRHHWLLRVRGQHTKTTGRRGRTVGVAKKK